MGRNMIRLLRFAINYRGNDAWHPYGHDDGTVRALRRLADMGFIERDVANRKFRLVPAKASEQS